MPFYSDQTDKIGPKLNLSPGDEIVLNQPLTYGTFRLTPEDTLTVLKYDQNQDKYQVRWEYYDKKGYEDVWLPASTVGGIHRNTPLPAVEQVPDASEPEQETTTVTEADASVSGKQGKEAKNE